MTDDLNGNHYDEEFILRAVAIAHARTWSNPAIAASLCIPSDLYDEWIKNYSDKVKVAYLGDIYVRGKRYDSKKLERCPGCGSEVVFDPVKTLQVQREEGVDIGTHSSIMNSGDDGILGAKVPYVKITTEVIARCPACGIYVIRNVTEKVTNSEA
jgi:DNA-directed RNA polymerase subunit RPC12/RpoP